MAQMAQPVNSSRLFNASCFALITTAFSFSIRAGILSQLGVEFNLTAEQLGFINSMWFLGFPLAMIIGGLVYHTVGPKIIMQIAFFCHAIGIVLTIYSGGYVGLLLSTFLIGIGNGCTEAACNPMIADTYTGLQMNKMLNRFHMWFPGGIVVGSLLSKFMTDANLGWQAQIWLILIPALVYAYLFWGQAFPRPHVEGANKIGENFKAMFTPIFIFIFLCMALTAISEFGPQQWTGMIMSKSGASPMLILALVTGLMAIIRFFAAPIVSALGATGILWGSSILAFVGIYLFSTVTGPTAYFAAIIFAMGVGLFWPTMLGFIAQNVPLSGALGMSLVGGIGMFSTAIFQPIIGRWLDEATAEKLAQGLSGDQLQLAAGQATLNAMLIFPGILIVAFGILFFWQRGKAPVAVAAH